MEKKNRFPPSFLGTVGGVLLILFNGLFSFITRPFYSKWGAKADEIRKPLPGDELVPVSRLTSTRAIDIHAPAVKVFPWLLQMGQSRGGLYSYEALENIARCDIHNAHHILPEFQILNPGDPIKLGPDGYPFFIVHQVIEDQTLVLKGQQEGEAPMTTWVFHVEETAPETSRLIIRTRLTYKNGFVNFLMWRVFSDPISFVMERMMLIGIKARAEYWHQKA